MEGFVPSSPSSVIINKFYIVKNTLHFSWTLPNRNKMLAVCIFLGKYYVILMHRTCLFLAVTHQYVIYIVKRPYWYLPASQQLLQSRNAGALLVEVYSLKDKLTWFSFTQPCADRRCPFAIFWKTSHMLMAYSTVYPLGTLQVNLSFTKRHPFTCIC